MNLYDDTVVTPMPRLRSAHEGKSLRILPQEVAETKDYEGYYRAFLILGVFILAAIVAVAVVSFWGADQTAQMNQLQQCMSRINPDPNTNYQLETYKCMNGSK